MWHLRLLMRFHTLFLDAQAHILQVEGQEHRSYFLQEISCRSVKSKPVLRLLQVQPCMLLIFSGSNIHSLAFQFIYYLGNANTF